MKIHLESDIHMEMHRGHVTMSNVASDVCICAGDISTLYEKTKIAKAKQYFRIRKTLAEHVIWVLGNHEFYHMERQNTYRTAQAIAQDTGVILLDEAIGNPEITIDGVTFWGSTLWSDLKNNDPMINSAARFGINDFFHIQEKNAAFSPEDMLVINQRTRNLINWDADVVITHFPPMVIKHSRFPISDISYYFCNSGLEDQIADSTIKYWIYGHDHDSKVIECNKTIVISNQLGYQNLHYQEECNFDYNQIIEI